MLYTILKQVFPEPVLHHLVYILKTYQAGNDLTQHYRLALHQYSRKLKVKVFAEQRRHTGCNFIGIQILTEIRNLLFSHLLHQDLRDLGVQHFIRPLKYLKRPAVYYSAAGNMVNFIPAGA
ncbi:hypothetical protein D9M70_565400 [compost metagenome]